MLKKLLNHIKEKWINYVFETIVVVTGILIAFGLNNWSESRSKDEIKLNHLISLKSDFENNLNSLQLNRHVEQLIVNYSGLLFSEQDIKLDETPKGSITVAAELSSYNPKFPRFRSSFDNIINSGNLPLFVNTTLIKYLNSYYNLIAQKNIISKESEVYKFEWREKKRGLIPVPVRNQIATQFSEVFSNKASMNPLDLDVGDESKILKYLNSNFEIKDIIEDIRQLRVVELGFLETESETIELILSEIEIEIKKLD